MTREEMIAGNEDQFLGLGCVGYNRLQRIVRAEYVVVTAKEQLWLVTFAEKLVGVQPAFGFDGSAQRDQRTNLGIRTAGTQTPCRPKGKSGKDDRQRELPLQPRQRSPHVLDLFAPIVSSRAQAGAAKIEPQNWKP